MQREKIKLAYEQRYFDYAQEEYENLLKRDPFNVEGMDNYSNILFVKDCRNQLANIAKKFEETHKVSDIDKLFFIVFYVFLLF